MAKQTIVKLIDDIDGSPATASVEFAVDGNSYTIDINDKHIKELRSKLAPFLEVARKVRLDTRGSRASTTTSGSNKARNSAIREWALSEGVQLPTRGRIARVVQETFLLRDGQALRAAFDFEEEQPEEVKPKTSRRKAPLEFSAAA
jgi:hypothetical protein